MHNSYNTIFEFNNNLQFLKYVALFILENSGRYPTLSILISRNIMFTFRYTNTEQTIRNGYTMDTQNGYSADTQPIQKSVIFDIHRYRNLTLFNTLFL